MTFLIRLFGVFFPQIHLRLLQLFEILLRIYFVKVEDVQERSKDAKLRICPRNISLNKIQFKFFLSRANLLGNNLCSLKNTFGLVPHRKIDEQHFQRLVVFRLNFAGLKSGYHLDLYSFVNYRFCFAHGLLIASSGATGCKPWRW